MFTIINLINYKINNAELVFKLLIWLLKVKFHNRMFLIVGENYEKTFAERLERISN